jgi:hypothetical protein
VQRVTRIHNRFLRNRFERRMEELLAHKAQSPAASSADSDSEEVEGGATKGGGTAPRRALEYLFYGECPALLAGVGERELLRVAEHGFRRMRDYHRIGMDAAVRLSNR